MCAVIAFAIRRAPGTLRAMEAVDFAHPVECELARLYDVHGIEWQYEPHTFVLAQDPDGTVREAFTPDFYLPELDVYVECTVMRQALTRRKRRKIERARERRGVAVGVLYLRDFRQLARRWSFDGLDRATVSADGRRV
jgi:hypothetical protein